jgi:GNAT superfamily N-acetyltransferase
MEIIECHSDEEISATFSVMSQLRPKLQKSKYVDLIHNLENTEKYQLTAVISNNDCIATAGYRIIRSLFTNGEATMYINDLVTDAAQQGKGIGKFLFAFLKQKAKALNCKTITLDSGNQRIDAHHFYEQQGMQKVGLNFSMSLE